MARGGRRRGRSVPRRRRRGAPKPQRATSVLETMSTRPRSLQTLLPDGTILEELIEQMQEEYGTPSTPQEYRLLIKVASQDEQKEPKEPAAAASSAAGPAGVEEANGKPGEATNGNRPARSRRRRGRRRGRGRREA